MDATILTNKKRHAQQ